ncbi:MAG TPA: ABC transporter ATP-binding protein [Candidatus Stackebrandtia faecavium]|nr:ABC transporter ATP-binding protein [Candidatus Stackebrandtia faecavium]
MHTDTAFLDARLRVERRDFVLDVSLRIDAGEVVALLGPNGAGKTTALRTLAGLQPLSQGHIRLGGDAIVDTERRHDIDAHRRDIGVVFQEYLLFPHLTAVDNVAFGLRRSGLRKQEARKQAHAWLDRVALGEYAQRKPRDLSGGQAQKVALARALALEPGLLLLDEPMAALDAGTRLHTRSLLQTHLRNRRGTTLLVTHDPLDALMLADRLVIVEDGEIVQVGDAAAITAQPKTEYVAHLVGLNLYSGTANGSREVAIGGVEFTVDSAVDGDVYVAFAPQAVAVYTDRPHGSPRNTWAATVTGVSRHGDNLRLTLSGPIDASADITPSAASDLRLDTGSQVWAAVKASETRAYPA